MNDTSDKEAGHSQWKGSPISKLSPELLTHILNFTRNEFPDDTEHDKDFRRRIATIATQVSRFWRDVALDHHLWWTELTIYHPWNIEAVDTYLKRSQQRHLDLRILTTTPLRKRPRGYTLLPPSEDDCLDLLKIIFPHFHRCRFLELNEIFRRMETHKEASGYFDQLLSAPFPHLERFTFADDLRAYRAYTTDVKRPFLSPSLAPSLRDLRLIGQSLDAIHLPSSTITTLHLSKRTYGEISYANLVEELQTCQNLTELAIYNDVLNLLESYPDYIRCRLPSLKTLLLLGNMDMVSELLVSLDTPNLEELVVAPAAGLPDFELYLEMKDASRVVQPPFPNLRRLTLAPKGPTEFTEVMECASGAFPLIEQLTLANLYPGEFVFAFTSNNPLLFLKMVDLALTDVDATIADALYSIGAFRLAEGIPLRNFILDSESFKRVSEHFSEGTPHFQLQEGNPWKDRRKTLLDKDVKDLYLGRRQ